MTLFGHHARRILSALGRPATYRDGALWLMTLVALAIPAGLLAIFHYRVDLTTLQADSLHEYVDWVNGEPFFGRFRHNLSASWTSSLGLFLDIEIGPYGLWSYLIAYVLLGFAFVAAGRLAAGSLGRAAGIALTAVLVLVWFSWMNTHQSFVYLWRLPEIGSQMAALAFGCLTIGAWRRGRWRSASVLFAGLFVFSNTHGGFLYFTGTVVLLLLLETDLRRRLALLVLLAAHTFYSIFIDGSYAQLLAFSANPAIPAHDAGPLDYLSPIIALLVRSPLNLFYALGHPAAATILTVSIIGTTAGLAAIALYLTVRRKDAVAAMFLLIVGSQVLFVAMAVFGRLGELGENLPTVLRYQVYSLVLFFALVWYGLHLGDRRLGAAPIVLLLGGLALSHIPQTRQRLEYEVAAIHKDTSAAFAMALYPAGTQVEVHLPPEEETARRITEAGLRARNAEVFGASLWRAKDTLPGLLAESEPEACKTFYFVETPPEGEAFRRLDFFVRNPLVKGGDAVMVVSSAGRVIAISPTLTNPTGLETYHGLVYLDQAETNPTFVYVKETGGRLEIICTDIYDPDPADPNGRQRRAPA